MRGSLGREDSVRPSRAEEYFRTFVLFRQGWVGMVRKREILIAAALAVPGGGPYRVLRKAAAGSEPPIPAFPQMPPASLTIWVESPGGDR